MARLIRQLCAHQSAKLYGQPVFDAVIHALAVFLARQDTGGREQGKMLRHIRLCRAGRGNDLGHRARRFADGLQDFQAHRLAEQPEVPRDLL